MSASRPDAAAFEHFRAGRLHPPIDHVYPMAEARAAFERMAHAEQFGKLVVRVAP